MTIVRSVLRNDGVRGLYRGVTPSLIGATMAWGLYFPIYNGITDQLKLYHNGNVPGSGFLPFLVITRVLSEI